MTVFMTNFSMKASVKIEIYKVISELRNFCRLQEIVFIVPCPGLPRINFGLSKSKPQAIGTRIFMITLCFSFS